jgi:hypothetical protein
MDPDGNQPIVIAALIGGGINSYNNKDKISEWKSDLAYFGNGAIGGAIAAIPGVNLIAVSARTSILNITTDILTGNKPSFNDGYDLASYAFGHLSDGLSVAGAGAIGNQVSNTIRRAVGEAPIGYAWARVGGGDLVMADSAFVQGMETTSRTLVEVGKGATKGGLTNPQLVQKSATLAQRAIGGTGGVACTAKHQYASKLLNRYQSIYGNRGLETGIYFYKGVGNRGFLDVIDHTNGIIYDFKFGKAVMSPVQYNKYFELGIYEIINL